MLDKIPSAEEMMTLVGQSLYDVWNKLCTLIDAWYTCCTYKNMKWNVYGIKVERHGLMSINIAEVVRHSVRYMPEKIV